MPRTIRYHLDENCDPRIASGLRAHGIDVTTTMDAGLLHAQDEEQLSHAHLENRVIFTQDADFLRFHSAGVPHPGIAYCRPKTRSLGEIIRMLVLLWEVYDPGEMRGRIEFL
jgi:predicted nuclease of predicted toxin-antitoxin system